MSPLATPTSRRADRLAGRLLKRSGAEIVALRQRAWARPWDGRTLPPQNRAVLTVDDPDKLISVLLTYDVGAHNCGWWRNSEYDRCWHLSMVVVGRLGFSTPTDLEVRTVSAAFFGEDVRRSWLEPPASAFDAYRTLPQSRNTLHVRVFTDRAGHAITPEGEVYTLKPWDDGTSPAKVFRS